MDSRVERIVDDIAFGESPRWRHPTSEPRSLAGHHPIVTVTSPLYNVELNTIRRRIPA